MQIVKLWNVLKCKASCKLRWTPDDLNGHLHEVSLLVEQPCFLLRCFSNFSVKVTGLRSQSGLLSEHWSGSTLLRGLKNYSLILKKCDIIQYFWSDYQKRNAFIIGEDSSWKLLTSCMLKFRHSLIKLYVLINVYMSWSWDRLHSSILCNYIQYLASHLAEFLLSVFSCLQIPN